MGKRWIPVPFLLWPFLWGGQFLLLRLVFWLVVGAGVWTLLLGDIDAFEERTGLFDFIGSMIINGIVLLVALACTLGAVAVFFPRSWGEKPGIVGAIFCALGAAFCWRVLWLGGV